MQDVVTAADLEAMTPAQRQAHFDGSVVTDLSEVPPGYLEVARARLRKRIAELEGARTAPSQGSSDAS